MPEDRTGERMPEDRTGDLNLVVIAGKVAAEPEVRTLDSGVTLLRLLVMVRTEQPERRLDVIPVVQWNPDPETIPEGNVRGGRVWVAGSLQRRFVPEENKRYWKIEMVAQEVSFRD